MEKLMQEKQDFKVSISLADTQNDTGSYDCVVNATITDAGRPFCQAEITYSDVPAETLDAMEAMFSSAVGQLPRVIDNLSERGMQKIERDLLSLLMKFNDMGAKGIGKSRAEKVAFAKQFVKSGGHKRSKA